jgi:hypothetical protein
MLVVAGVQSEIALKVRDKSKQERRMKMRLQNRFLAVNEQTINSKHGANTVPRQNRILLHSHRHQLLLFYCKLTLMINMWVIGGVPSE